MNIFSLALPAVLIKGDYSDLFLQFENTLGGLTNPPRVRDYQTPNEQSGIISNVSCCIMIDYSMQHDALK